MKKKEGRKYDQDNILSVLVDDAFSEISADRTNTQQHLFVNSGTLCVVKLWNSLCGVSVPHLRSAWMSFSLCVA